ncbi:CNPV107 hypothetical protein [Canarypox virus]|uniref:SWPV2-ORF102 n=2 Tax=Canarypox virus TaxID=44088 RepID=A0A1V0QG62_CNPV|nr:CNPV107 hypothetical protein [Canarypox virus]ARE67325.1 SWPV2-ORF102 [Shearwaterpox virus]QGM48738.1 hypothetical protein [Magpiepox virus]QRI42821.1 hypothetical protein ChPV103 [Cheloniid poxvirus 1]QRM15382.1 hypothetical protein [Mudlarkpox virus]QRM15740.1 hypothetical protein [Penguinpox virus 2]QRM16072.1 hypothetical protein [Albatrosspox virus]QZW33408.1 MPPV-114 hypothetical protein [Magpiepox virus 2]
MTEKYKGCRCQCCCCKCDCRGELLDSWNHNYECIYSNIMISRDKNIKNIFKSLYGHFLFSISLLKDFFTIHNTPHSY